MAYPGGPGAPVGPGPALPAAPVQQEKFDSAIEFLERVKVVYADQPNVYNQFLDIMKGFKTHTIDTTGVIQRVKNLFKGHPELTRGFAAFLPKEYKMEAQDVEDEDGGHHDAGRGGGAMQVGAVQQQQLQQQAQQQAQQQVQQQVQQQGGQGGDLGEEHARIYVKKIKTRFANQPHISKSFFDILHTFHREKHTIQDVYAQVALLFKDHADLLAEFGHFLPDPNAPQGQQGQLGGYPQQPQHHEDHVGHHHHHGVSGGAGGKAGGRGGRGGRGTPMHEQQTQQQQQQGTSGRAGRNSAAGVASAAAAAAANQAAMAAQGHNMLNSRGTPVMGGGVMASRGATPQVVGGGLAVGGGAGLHVGGMAMDQAGSKERSHGTFEELMHFFKIRQALPQNDYEEFLKLLSMYNADVLTKNELYFMVRDLLRHQDLDLLDWFRKFVQVEDLKDDEPQGYLADYDWTTSEKLGPSYRSMPRPWANWKCSGRQGNNLCQEVLNDAWISVPTGSEDGAFKNSRKNQYEELLFKCEDDRFELDLLVEGNANAIKALEVLQTNFKTLSPSALNTFQLNETDVDVLTIKAIRRVYTTRSDEFIKMLMAKPALALPIILNRLKNKNIEWNLARREWNVLWKQIFKKNYHKSLDHRSTAFKQEEKKMLTPKALFAELKRAMADKTTTTNSQTQPQDGAMDVVQPLDANHVNTDKTSSNNNKADSSVGSPTLSFPVLPRHLFADIRHLLVVTFKTQFPKADLAKFEKLWEGVISPFFHVDTTIKSVSPLIDGEKDLVTANKESTNNDMEIDGKSAEIKTEEMTTTAAAPSSSSSTTTEATTTVENGNAEAAVLEAQPTNKPISTELATQPPTHHMLFLGNDAFYLAFRYLQILYDRLNEAWSFSEQFPPVRHLPVVEIETTPTTKAATSVETTKDQNKMDTDVSTTITATTAATTSTTNTTTASTTSAVASGDAITASSSSSTAQESMIPTGSSIESQGVSVNESEARQAAQSKLKVSLDENVSRYAMFLKDVEQLLTGAMDLPTFEEECRSAFGISCFPLFTMDKLLYLLAKQLHTVNSDETSEKLSGLFRYEASRSLGGFTDAVYLSNCREVLSNDKRAYVFTYDWSGETPLLGITEVDLGHPSFGLEHNEELSRYINNLAHNESAIRGSTTPGVRVKTEQTAATTGADGNNEPNGVVQHDETTGNVPRSANDSPSSLVNAPFLKRNLDPESTETKPDPAVQNDLGVKVIPGSYKLRFVGGTEDFLQRTGRNTSHQLSSDKIEIDALQAKAQPIPSPSLNNSDHDSGLNGNNVANGNGTTSNNNSDESLNNPNNDLPELAPTSTTDDANNNNNLPDPQLISNTSSATPNTASEPMEMS